MVVQTFDLILKLKDPKPVIGEYLNFKWFSNQIKKSIEISNNINNKSIKLVWIKSKFIKLRLKIQTTTGIQNPSIELLTMSRYLYNTCGWSKYVTLPHKLFSVIAWPITVEEVNPSVVQLIVDNTLNLSDITNTYDIVEDNKVI